MVAKVAESLFRKATGDHRQSVTAAIFWLKTRAGWKEGAAPEPGGGWPTRIELVSPRAVLADRVGAVAARIAARKEPSD